MRPGHYLKMLTKLQGQHALKTRGLNKGTHPARVGGMAGSHCTQHIAVFANALKTIQHQSKAHRWSCDVKGFKARVQGNSFKAKIKSNLQTQVYRNAQARTHINLTQLVNSYVLTFSLAMTTDVATFPNLYL